MFRVGDEVVCVDVSVRAAFRGENMPLTKGHIYTVKRTLWDDLYNEAGVVLQEVASIGYLGGFAASRFRKVQRRDLTEWLSTSIKNTDHIDKRKRVKA